MAAQLAAKMPPAAKTGGMAARRQRCHLAAQLAAQTGGMAAKLAASLPPAAKPGGMAAWRHSGGIDILARKKGAAAQGKGAAARGEGGGRAGEGGGRAGEGGGRVGEGGGHAGEGGGREIHSLPSKLYGATAVSPKGKTLRGV